jgi:mannose-6-phosphate isomerase-like protein (cupin superfamily)
MSNLNEVVLGPDDGKALWMLGGLYVIKASGGDTGGSYSIVERTVAPGPHGGAPPHIHHCEEEAFYVLEGTLTIHVGDRAIDAIPGSFVLVPRGTVHAHYNHGATPAKTLEIFSPAGFEKFFEEACEPAQARTLPPPITSPPDVQRLIALGRKYNAEFLPAEGR